MFPTGWRKEAGFVSRKAGRRRCGTRSFPGKTVCVQVPPTDWRSNVLLLCHFKPGNEKVKWRLEPSITNIILKVFAFSLKARQFSVCGGKMIWICSSGSWLGSGKDLLDLIKSFQADIHVIWRLTAMQPYMSCLCCWFDFRWLEAMEKAIHPVTQVTDQMGTIPGVNLWLYLSQRWFRLWPLIKLAYQLSR